MYEDDGVNGLYYHDVTGNYTNALQEARDNSYRYSGSNPSNYVCFGTDASPCPDANLYRIIGLFENNGNYQLKLWFDTINNWGGSVIYDDLLPWTDVEIYKTLKAFYEELSSQSKLLISSYNWKFNNNYYFEKIGLLYPLDYVYGSNPLYWNKNGSSKENWIFYDSEWVLAASTDYSFLKNGKEYNVQFLAGSFCYDYTVIIQSNGTFGNYDVCIAGENIFRMSFYLNYDVQYVSGDGSLSNPYRIV